MIEFPIIAFNLQGYDNEHIQLTIEEVFGFPNETAYGGGYGANGTLDVRVGPYCVNANHFFTTGELYEFYRQMQKCYETLVGEAVLNNTEKELYLKLTFCKTGKICATGEFKARLDLSTSLRFEMHFDQTAISEVLASLDSVYQNFGDSKGLSQA